MRRAPQAHYVRHNMVTRVPRAFIYLDTEAHQQDDGRTQVQTFRLAVAALDRRYHHRDGWREREWATFTEPRAIWEWVDAQCHAKARTILVCHKLDYDLRVGDAFHQLLSLGWELDGIRLGSTHAWASWKREGRTLVMVDSLSWVNMALARVGDLLHMPKLDLPAWDDTDAAWLARCTRDVEILATMYRRLIDWVRAEDLGNWKATGAGQSLAAFRHRFMTHKLLVHEDDEARAAERVAGYTGRCEAWRWGTLTNGPFTEWDYTTAYARIGVECDVPTQLLGELRGGALFRLDEGAHRTAVLVECDITTETPTVPTKVGERIVWPVGSFSSTLWDCEVALARANGATVIPTRGWAYRKAPALAAFCRWCLDILDAPEGTHDPIVRAAVKHWSRALIGRFGSRYSSWDDVGRMPDTDVALGLVNDPDTGEVWRALQLGNKLLRQSAEFDSADAIPAVMTWVMAQARVRLWNAAQVAGVGHVAYLDTDSLIVDRDGNDALAAAALPGFRVKSEWRTVRVLGPRQLVLAGELRASGVPRGAHEVEPGVWEGDVWSGLTTSIAQGEPDVVRISQRRMRMRGTDTRRLHAPGGVTYPLAV